MNVLSLFDGISCGRLALENLGIHITNYYGAEIDKYALEISKKHYPDTIHLGDVKTINLDELPKIDILLAGSPCQGFSEAGLQKGFEDPRSNLFFEFIRIKNELKPKYFLLENVNMKREWLDKIDFYTGVKGVKINSYLFSAQSRTRWYWTNIPLNELPAPSPLVINDMLDKDATQIVDRSKFTFYPIDNHNSPYGIKCIGGFLSPNETPRNNLVNKNNHFRSQQRVLTSNGKYECVTTRHHQFISNSSALRENQRVLSPEGKYSNVKAMNTKPFINTNLIRKPSILELERLQGLPDNYTKGVSKTQRHKAIGNGWNIPTIEFLLSNIAA